MSKIVDFQNIGLPLEESQFYGNVDGLSLQNLFYTRKQSFPGCFLFSYDARTNGDHYFDTKKMFDYLSENIP